MTQNTNKDRVQTLEQGFQFGNWQAWPHANTLTRRASNGSSPPTERVSPKAMQVLVQLAARPGEFVSKDQLLSSVWSGRVVTEDVLTGAIRVLRRAMADNPSNPEVIETRKGSGYRLIVDVRPDDGSSATSMRHKWRWAIAASLLIAGAFGAVIVLSPSEPGIRTVAVLPFLNLSGDDRGAHLADAMTDALIFRLAQHDGLDVISRTSVSGLGDDPSTLPVIASRLGAGYLVEGSVLADNGNLRIVAQLIDAEDDLHVWARQYDRPVGDILNLQSEVAGHIAAQIVGLVAGQVAPAIPAIPTDDAEALLEARYLLAQEQIDPVSQARDTFDALRKRHPELAAAHLGWAQSTLYLFKRFRATTDDLELAFDAAARALALDPSRTDAYRELGQIVFFKDWDFGAAESFYSRAIEHNGSDTITIRRYAWLLVAMDRFDEAQAQIDRGRQIDPLYYGSEDGALLLLAAGQPHQAVAELESLNGTVSNSAKILDTLAMAYWAVGRYEDSAQALIASRSAMVSAAGAENDLAAVYAREGRDGVYRYLLASNAFRGPVRQAALLAQIGDYGSALDVLDQALAERDPRLLFIAAQPEFQPIHDNPRYRDLIAQIQR